MQTFFYSLAKGTLSATDGVDWAARMVGVTSRRSLVNPNFRAYLAPGTEHCVINRASFYTQSVGGVSFSDWVKSLLSRAL